MPIRFWDEWDVLRPPPSAFGTVAGWGRVIVHERGDWRSQYAYPGRLALHCRSCFDHYNLLLMPAQYVLLESAPRTLCNQHYQEWREQGSEIKIKCLPAAEVERELVARYGIELIGPDEVVWGPRQLPPEIAAARAAQAAP